MGKEHGFRYLTAMAAFAVVSILSGCATMPYRPHAKVRLPVSVGIGSAKLSKITDIVPIDLYFERDGVIVLGDPKLQWTVILVTESKVTYVDMRNILRNERWEGLPGLLSDALKARLDSKSAPEISEISPQGGIVQLTPFACLKVTDDGGVVVFAMIQADANDQAEGISWSERYYARIPGKFSMRESDSNALDVDRFTIGLKAALSDALQLFLDDLNSRLSERREEHFRGDLPRMPGGVPVTFNSSVVEDRPDAVVFALKGALNPNRGVYLARKGEFEPN